jgi:hypothetical protein
MTGVEAASRNSVRGGYARLEWYSVIRMRRESKATQAANGIPISESQPSGLKSLLQRKSPKRTMLGMTSMRMLLMVLGASISRRPTGIAAKVGCVDAQIKSDDQSTLGGPDISRSAV